MREIKFRAWKKSYRDIESASVGGWNYYNFPNDFMKCWDIDALAERPITKWCQYTGLKDKNGKEIYEGDVVEFKNAADPLNPDTPPVREEVVFAHGSFYPSIGAEMGEIIGNVWESPDLLET